MRPRHDRASPRPAAGSPTPERVKPPQPWLGSVVLLVGMFWCPPAEAIDRATVDRLQGEIVRYAQAHGETLSQFTDEIGSPLWHIESFVYQAELGGGTADEALDHLRTFAVALTDPAKRLLLKCLGIRVPRDVDPAPSPIDCAVLKRRFGAP